MTFPDTHKKKTEHCKWKPTRKSLNIGRLKRSCNNTLTRNSKDELHHILHPFKPYLNNLLALAPVKPSPSELLEQNQARQTENCSPEREMCSAQQGVQLPNKNS
jgi:predicted nucleic acid binding AN1-type Zn finger protein